MGSCKDKWKCGLERSHVVLVMEGIRHGDAILVDIRRKRIFHCTWYFFSLPDPSRTWHSEGVSDDIRFLCINPLRPVINGGLLTKILTGRSSLKEACLGSGCHQEALRNWD